MKYVNRSYSKNKKWDGGKETYYRTISKETMEKHLGRKLFPEEVVHHIDGDYTNNNIENLYLFNNTNQHTSYHNRLRGYVRQAIKEGIKWNMNYIYY